MVIREAVRFGDGYLYTEEEGLSETEEEYGEQTEQAELQAMEQVLDESQSSQPDEIQTDQPEENFQSGKAHSPERTGSGFYAAWTDIYKEARGYLYGTQEAEPDAEAAYEIMKEEAENGNAYAMHDMGKIYAQGIFVEPDKEMAQEWYGKALAAMLSVEEEKADTYLEYRIGKMYQYGLGTAEDLSEAVKWFHWRQSRSIGLHYILLVCCICMGKAWSRMRKKPACFFTLP